MHIVRGVVQQGKQRGRELGYPTINIELRDKIESGIYAARVRVENQDHIAAAFVSDREAMLEAYILNFDRDLYGMEVEIELHKKIRESKDFESDEALKAAIATDIEAVREYFDL